MTIHTSPPATLLNRILGIQSASIRPGMRNRLCMRCFRDGTSTLFRTPTTTMPAEPLAANFGGICSNYAASDSGRAKQATDRRLRADDVSSRQRPQQRPGARCAPGRWALLVRGGIRLGPGLRSGRSRKASTGESVCDLRTCSPRRGWSWPRAPSRCSRGRRWCRSSRSWRTDRPAVRRIRCPGTGPGCSGRGRR